MQDQIPVMKPMIEKIIVNIGVSEAVLLSIKYPRKNPTIIELIKVAGMSNAFIFFLIFRK